MQNHLKIICIVSLSLLILKCTDPENTSAISKENKGSILSKVMVPAGEIFKDFDRLGIPTFFNIGNVEQKSSSEVVIRSIILGERVTKGKSISVKPIALFSFEQDSIKHNFLVSTYKSSTNDLLSDEFNAFMSINNELQLAIENWFRAQCGFSTCNSYEWKDTYKAFLNMD